MWLKDNSLEMKEWIQEWWEDMEEIVLSMAYEDEDWFEYLDSLYPWEIEEEEEEYLDYGDEIESDLTPYSDYEDYDPE